MRAVEGRKIGSLEEIEDKQVLVAVKTGTTFTKDRRTCTCFAGHSVRKQLVTGWVGGCVPHLCVGAGGWCSAAGHPATSACRVIGVRKAAYSHARNVTPSLHVREETTTTTAAQEGKASTHGGGDERTATKLVAWRKCGKKKDSFMCKTVNRGKRRGGVGGA